MTTKLSWRLFGSFATTWENAHHVFVGCPKMEGLITSAIVSMNKELEPFLLKLHDDDAASIQHLAQHLFVDSPAWPLGCTQYYLGRVPNLQCVVSHANPSVQHTRALATIHSILHTSSIRLAGRIWGQFIRI